MTIARLTFVDWNTLSEVQVRGDSSVDEGKPVDLIRKLAAERWRDAFGFVFAIGLLLGAIAFLAAIFAATLLGDDPESVMSGIQKEHAYRGVLRESLSAIALGVLAIAALPAVASRGSNSDNIHARVDRHAGWLIARLSTGLLTALAWLSFPLGSEEYEGLQDWLALPVLALVIVILVVTGPRDADSGRRIKSADDFISRLKASQGEARSDRLHANRWWRIHGFSIYLGGLLGLLLIWSLVTGLSEEAPRVSTLPLVLVTLAAGAALEAVLRIRLLLDPITRSAWIAWSVSAVPQLLLGFYLAAIVFVGLGSSATSGWADLCATAVALWVLGAAAVFTCKPPRRLITARVRSLDRKLKKARERRSDLEKLRDEEERSAN